MKRFKDRTDAGRILAGALSRAGYRAPVVLGIPRGGVPVAAQVAKELHGSLGVVVARKLRAPGQPELAIGAVTADGATWLNADLADRVGADARYLEQERATQALEARHREEAFDGHRRPAIAGEVVIIVDDGLATGATAIAAARSMRASGAARVVLAVPVAPPDSIEKLRGEVDEVVCPWIESDFWAIGEFYQDFRQVADAEVKSILESFGRPLETREARVRRDGVELAVRLRLPAADVPLVTFVHGLGSSKDSPRNVVIAERLFDSGIGVLLFDLSAHGDSTGTGEDGLDSYVKDLAAVAAWGLAQPGIDPARTAIAGSSLGATVALLAVARGVVHPSALVLRAPPISASDCGGIDIPTLVVIGSRDGLLPDVTEAARACPAMDLRIVPGATHLFEEEGVLEEATRITTTWLAEQLTAGGTKSEPGDD